MPKGAMYMMVSEIISKFGRQWKNACDSDNEQLKHKRVTNALPLC
jgi:hypothetical protein